MTIAASLILTVLVFAFIMYPFYRQRLRPLAPVESERLRELHSKRDTSYSMLKELEFDYASGILTEEDYRLLETKYKKKAIDVLKEMDNVENASPVEDEVKDEDEVEKWVRQVRQKHSDNNTIGSELEKQVSQLRRKRNAGTKIGDRIERQVDELRKVPARFCSQCGSKVRESDRFCSNCGAQLG